MNRKPRGLAVVQGEQDRRLANPPEIESGITLPKGVRFDAAGQVEWDSVTSELAGVLTRLDAAMLQLWCSAVDQYWEAHQHLRREGRVLSEPILARGEIVGEKQVINPWFKIRADAVSEMFTLSRKFGFSLYDRQQIDLAVRYADRPGDDLLTG